MITVFTTPGCTQCRPTLRSFAAAGVQVRTVDVTTDDDAYTYITEELGYQSVPVVVLDDGTHWNEFRPDLIKQAVQSSTPQPLAS